MSARSALLAFRLATVCAPGVAWTQPACPIAHLPAYAHNDYANSAPLKSALALGYRGAEADVYLVDGELRLGHDARAASHGRAFEATYLAPLSALLMRCGTVTGDRTPFLLTVELKERAPAAFDSLIAVLGRHAALRDRVEFVLVGWHPVPAVLSAAPVRIGRQARMTSPTPLAPETVDATTRVVSIDYGKTMGRWWRRRRTRARWLDAIRRTRDAYPMLTIRVHNVPVDARTYRELLHAGVHLVGTKTLDATARVLEGLQHSP